MSGGQPNRDGLDEPPSSRRIVAAVLVGTVVAVLLLGGSGVHSATAQANGTITIDRDAGDLTVSIDGTAFNETPETVQLSLVELDGSGTVEFNLSRTSDETSATEGIADVVDELDPEPGASLANVTVQLTANETEVETSLSLQYITFDDRPVTVADGDRLAIPLDASEISPEADVQLRTVEENATTIDATVRSDGGAVLVDRADGADLDWDDGVSFEALVDGDVISTDNGSASAALRQVDGLAFWHPAIEADESYRVSAEHDGRYVSDLTANETGRLALPSALATGEEGSVTLTVTTERDSDSALYDGDIALPEPFSLRASVGSDGTSLDFVEPVDNLTVTGISDTDGDSYRPLSAQISDGELRETVMSVAPNSTVFLATEAGVADVTVVEASQEGSTNEEGEKEMLSKITNVLENALLVLGPLLTGFLIGLAMTQVRRFRPERKRALSGVIGFVGGAAVVAGLLWAPIELLEYGFINNTLRKAFSTIVIGVSSGIAAFGIAWVLTPDVRHPQSGIGGAAGTYQRTFTASITVSDGSRRLDGSTTITCTPQNRHAFETETSEITGGTGQIELAEGTSWTVVAKRGSHSSNPTTVRHNAPNASLQIRFPNVALTVMDANRDVEVPGAEVRLDTDAGTVSDVADRGGHVTLEPPEQATTGTLTVSHERYESTSNDVSLDTGVEGSVDVVPKTGDVAIRTRIDGAEAGPFDIELTPDDAELGRVTDPITTVTGSNGRTRERGLIVGTYRAKLTPSGRAGSLIDARAATVTITPDDTATVTVDGRFTWSLSSTQRSRLAKLRSEADALGGGGGRDTTIPEYYGSVVHTVLDAVEGFPEDGGQYVATNDRSTTPDDVVEALMSGAAQATTAIDEAMTTKRSIDLFAACSDMSAATVRWNGSVELATLFERIETERVQLRTQVKRRYESVSDGVDSHRGEMNEVAPVQEMLDRSWQLANTTDDASHLEMAVRAHLAMLLLAAVEQSFEHTAITDRLSRTVF